METSESRLIKYSIRNHDSHNTKVVRAEITFGIDMEILPLDWTDEYRRHFIKRELKDKLWMYIYNQATNPEFRKKFHHIERMISISEEE